MTRQIANSQGREYLFSSDNEIPLEKRIRAIISARVIDEITNEPPGQPVKLETQSAGLTARVTRDGIGGIIGSLEMTFPYLHSQDYEVDLTFFAEGYIPYPQTVTIDRVLNFPNDFAPPEINISLHREPIIISGRIIDASVIPNIPLDGANARIAGIWQTPPPAYRPVSSSRPDVVSIQPPLYLERTAASDFLRRREMSPIVGEDKQLLQAAYPDSTQLNLSDRVNLAAGDIILIDPDNLDLSELLTIEDISGASTADQPARIDLTHRLAHQHHINTLARKVMPQAPGSDNPLRADAISGDMVVFLRSMDELSSSSVVEITDGSSSEYHLLNLFSTNSDANGYYRLPALSRISQLEIEATHGGRTVLNTISVDYTQRENRIDFLFNG